MMCRITQFHANKEAKLQEMVAKDG